MIESISKNTIERYEALRSVSDKTLHVLCRAGAFYTLPDEVRHRGPWQMLRSGFIVHLRPEYRLSLAQDGYVVINQPIGFFAPEYS